MSLSPWWGLPACWSTLVPWEGVQTEKVDDAEA